MKLFNIKNNGNLIPYKEIKFESIKNETVLEELLEKNPEYFLIKITKYLLQEDNLILI